MRLVLSIFLSIGFLAATAQWSELSYPAGLVNRSVHFVNATTGYVGCYGDVRRTTDGGATWQSTSIGSDPLLFVVDLMGIQTFDANTVVAAGTNNANGTEYIVRSTDGGVTWDLVHVRSWGEELQDLYFPTSAVGYAVGDNGRILKSSNGGLTWTTQTSNTDEHLNGVYFSSESVGMAVGNHVVLTTTNGGTTWTATSTNWYLNDVRTTDGNTWFACGEEGVVLRSSNFGENWSNISLPTNSSCLRITASTLQRLFVAAEYGQIYVTHNQGGLWERVKLPAGSLTVNDIQADASLGGVGYAVTEGGRVFKTANLAAPALPIPLFQSMPGTVCTESSVTFQNLSSPTYTSTWKLNGATVANTADYSTVFSTTGTYEVRLIVNNGTYSDSVSKSITVLQSETAEPFMLENYPETICPGFWETIKVLSSVPGTTYQVYANGQPYSAVVEGNGNTANFFEQVMQVGVTYTVVSKRDTPCGIVEYVAPVDVNVLAVADQNVTVNISPTVLCDPGPVSITILQSQLGITYRIGNASAPGNGGPLTITIPNVAVTTTFTIIGSNAMNCNRTLNTAPTVTYSPMIADFQLSSTTPFVGQTVTVIDNSAAVSWDWALGVNATPAASSTAAPSFSYSTTGADTITVHLENSVGCTRDVIVGIHVYEPAPLDGGEACRVTLQGLTGWALSGPYDHVIGHHISDDGSTYLCGYTSTGLYPYTNTYNYFLRKLDANGTVLWTQVANPAEYSNATYVSSFANAITSDASGNIYLTGSFASSRFRFGTLVFQYAQVTHTPFIVKMDPDGNAQWAILWAEPGTSPGGGTDLLRRDDGSLWAIWKTGGNGWLVDAQGATIHYPAHHCDKLIRFDEDGHVLQIEGFGTTEPLGPYRAGLFNPNPSSWGNRSIVTVAPRMRNMPDGRIAVVGDISGPASLQFGSGTLALTDPVTVSGGYIAVFDPATNVWDNAFLTHASEQPTRYGNSSSTLRVFPVFAVDDAGDIAVATNWEKQYPGGTGTGFRVVLGDGEVQVGDSGSVLMKWSPDGQLLWKRRNHYLSSRDLEWQDQRFVLLSEYRTFLGLVGSPGSTSVGVNATGKQDVGLAMYSDAGDVLGVLPLGSAGMDKGYNMVVHPCGGIQLPGVTDGPLSLNGQQLNGSQYELYLMRYASAGQCAVASCPSIITAIDEPTVDLGGAWPNPADAQVTIALPDGSAATTARLIDATGRIVALDLQTTGTQASAELRTVLSGAYVLQVHTAQGWLFMGKLVVMH